MPKLRLTFNTALWLITGVILVALFGWPLLMNVWAGHAWSKTPCHINEDPKGLFSYTVGDTRYLSGRRDFWVINGATHTVPGDISSLDDNSTCWVNPSDPLDPVLHLDALTNWTNCAGRLAAAGALLGGTVLITFFGSKKSPARSKAPVSR